MNTEKLYAFDFDGVICDSAVETAMTGWKAAARLWDDMPVFVPAEAIEQFRRIRPIIETGYQAILAMRLLFLDQTPEAICRDYLELAPALLAQVNGGIDELKRRFGDTRDCWIADDLTDWIAMNPLFPGLEQMLRQLQTRHPCYIITTKQERFVKQILKAHAVVITDERVFGLDRNLSKPEVLLSLLQAHPEKKIVFIEDRLPTLEKVIATPGLADVDLMFALWGYNTEADRLKAECLPVRAQTLDEFLFPFGNAINSIA